jgi:hypothetical protein
MEVKMKKFLISNKGMVKINGMFIILNLVVSMFAVSFLMGMVIGQDPENSEPDTNVPSGGDISNPDPEGKIPSTGIGGGTGGDPIKHDPDVHTDTDPGTIHSIFSGAGIQAIIQKGTIGAGIFGTIGALAGGDDGAQWGALAGGIGGAVSGLLDAAGASQAVSIVAGLGIATAIFLLTYHKKTEEVVEFICLPWQAPIGGGDCQVCNEFEHCSEYMCKSLGQACEIINPGTQDQKCVWVNPNDVNSPIIKMVEVNDDHTFIPDTSIRPPATGVEIKPDNRECIRAFFPLEFTFITRDPNSGIGEPSQCKIGYNLTRGFEEMEYFVAGDNLFRYNHTEKLSLPGPAHLNAVNPELKNDGDYTLFIRCQDANGNFNQDAYSVSFCVEKGPDTTPPLIVDTNVPSGNPVKFNQTSFELEVYVNEPSECKWSREDREYEDMEHEMECASNLFEMNNQQVYPCETTLTGLEDRKDNEYYFKCKDQPWAQEGDRNTNKQSYLYTVVGTQPLNIVDIGPKEDIFGSTDTIPVFLEVTTDNGHDNGKALCYYYNDEENGEPSGEEDYLLFLDTKSNVHSQRQDLVEGDYKYFIKCVDLGGNAAYDSVEFRVETDREAPLIVRVYRESELKIITNENAECGYSNSDCNFEVETGIEMDTLDFQIHTTEWILNRNYYVRCKDKHNNQPNPNTCSIIVRPSLNTEAVEEVSGFGFSF